MALAALAQETRLSIFRLLVEAGPEGVSAGRIGETLEVPACNAVLPFEGTCSCGSRILAAGKAVYLLRSGLRTYGGTYDFSNAELLPGNAGEVSYRGGDGTWSLLSP